MRGLEAEGFKNKCSQNDLQENRLAITNVPGKIRNGRKEVMGDKVSARPLSRDRRALKTNRTTVPQIPAVRELTGQLPYTRKMQEMRRRT